MDKSEEVILTPMYRLPVLIAILGLFILLTPLPLWTGISTSIFSLFLLIQSFTLRLKITTDDFIVIQLGREIRRFPFKNWIAWRIFLPQLPGILYFRETASPHLLPILFDKTMLESQLKLRVGSLEIKNQ
ncbi:putative membrane protein [Prochlorococcus sp. MIT 0603]|nr:putative membrane protein [Prochlorococcus sp. MIT 0603]